MDNPCNLTPILPFFLILIMGLFSLGAIYFSFMTAVFCIIIRLFLKVEIILNIFHYLELVTKEYLNAAVNIVAKKKKKMCMFGAIRVSVPFLRINVKL